ncbi:SDR family oxidoreductase [Neolewinella aurantiaca]|uniref:SDR family oxidoreductase n=1 Tax=Neolewinella aurantiaca TaxID=2602767 RepID=A0A5C7FL57_9BACT|nr:SDR family oxidoreductase [Neolewinella aurantiaca]TXF90773.1 SDR family oxidoreductase [Neolewinella aurantiaca]
MNADKQNVLIAGANGTTGRQIVQLLKDSANYNPIAMVRKQEQKDRFEKDQVDTVLADLTEDLSHAVENADKVIFAAGSKGKKLKAVDQDGAKKLADATKKAGGRKFVMLSSMGADNPSASDELQDYLEAKHNADEHLRATGLNYTIVRPGSLTDESGSGKITLRKKLDSQGSIPRADVARTLVEVLDDDVMHNETFEIVSGDAPVEKAVRPS